MLMSSSVVLRNRSSVSSTVVHAMPTVSSRKGNAVFVHIRV